MINQKKLAECVRLSDTHATWFNCYNFALYMVGVTNTIDWTDAFTMMDELAANFEEASRLKIGDLMVFYDEESFEEIIHAAVYVGYGLFHHKRGSCPLKTYVTLDEITKEYPHTHSKIFRLATAVKKAA